MAAIPVRHVRCSWDDIRIISYCFFLYKGLLFLIALLTPGVGYDTSTSLLSDDGFFKPPPQYGEGGRGFLWSEGFSISPLKFARWDAIYFLEAARRGGYVFEQEWAFSRVFSYLIGFYAYITALHQEEQHAHFLVSRDLRFLLAGSIFAFATLIRSNGLLSGCLFVYDFASDLFQVINSPGGVTKFRIRRMIVLLVGGSFIAIGFALPQVIAFKQYCLNAVHHPTRPWCYRPIPTIYGFVQEHYW
ncbi:ER membrane glycoprotein subunit of the GPI transamidase complex-like protein [Ascosphaera aggregata]|nr:ER membrane glycoprotein subunit of the GPI transamidase complex-like protein [Ascosphaera aggregata]